ncbi:uncharacterized protein BJ212DRAFT_1295732 [Suillus subaureus]|uniref:Uncharacterized protein n=1 Tax=Suillus subaureus TaxID=48587 RepID=A0A9P7EL14_9AGAM|nr:uncharacterized protein BJ212DRAFT_1295732 [Suillus subaureus]KAG1824599.1 hypothetical protein BJ212DRAFT_1295732 [Suillus subaureus]
MQLTLLASLAVLCSAAFAAPLQARGDIADVIVDVQDVLNDATVNVLTRGSLVDVTAYVEDVLEDADVNVLTKRDGSLVNVIADVQDDLDDLTVNVLTKRGGLVDVTAGKYHSPDFLAVFNNPTVVEDVLNNRCYSLQVPFT